jgi:hypothetical protein
MFGYTLMCYSSSFPILITSLITITREIKTPVNERTIVQIFECFDASRYVPNHVNKAMIKPICMPTPDKRANFETPSFLLLSNELINYIVRIFIFRCNKRFVFGIICSTGHSTCSKKKRAFLNV